MCVVCAHVCGVCMSVCVCGVCRFVCVVRGVKKGCYMICVTYVPHHIT